MKKLTIVRHAKSSWKNPELKDIERPLNERGKRDAPFMGNVLKEKKIFPDAVYSSPAARALLTAKIIIKEINYPEEKIIIKKNIYEASVSNLLKIISSFPENYKHIMMFGHNPGFTLLSHYLCNSFNVNMPTCSFVHITFDVNSWVEITANSGTLLYFEYPKKYR